MTLLGPSYTLRPDDPLWPSRLCDLAHAPRCLELCGHLPSLSQAVAIVGTRHPDAQAARFARTLAAELVAAGQVIISGGAEGIDSEAHAGALEGGGQTVAVLGVPVDRPYPAANVPLFRMICARGAVLSEYPSDAVVYRTGFLARNRIIAALAGAVVVVQAPARSGALSTAREARRLGRPLFAVPFAPWEARGEGTVALLRRGALVCRGSRDVLSLAAAGSEREPTKRKRKIARRTVKAQEFQRLDPDEQAVVKVLEGGLRSADELCEATRLTAPRVQRALLMLLLSKVVCEVGSGRYGRTDYG